MQAWSDALDEYERRLDQFHAVMSDEAPPVGLWPPAELMGVPLPPELGDRARHLLERSREIEGELLAKKAALPAPRPAARTRRTTPSFSTISVQM